MLHITECRKILPLVVVVYLVSLTVAAPSVSLTAGIVPSLGAINLALRHAPRIYFHSQEQFYPSSIDFYFDQMKLQRNGQVLQERLNRQILLATIRAGDTTGMSLANRHGFSDARTNLWGEIFPWMRGQSASEGHHYPLYITIRQVSETELWVYYYGFFPFNEGKGGINSGLFGNHLGDWEHVRIKFNNNQPIEMLFHWHSDGATLPFNDPRIQKVEGTHPVIYCARGSHGFNFQPINRVYNHILSAIPLTDHFEAGPHWDTWNDRPEIYIKRNDGTFQRLDGGNVNDGDIWRYKGLWGTRQHHCPISADVCPWQYSDGPETPHFDT